ERGTVFVEIEGWRYKRLSGKRRHEASELDLGIRDRINACRTDEDRQRALERYLTMRLEETLSRPISDVDKPIIDFGLDSMLAVEIRNRAESELGLRV